MDKYFFITLFFTIYLCYIFVPTPKIIFRNNKNNQKCFKVKKTEVSCKNKI